MTVVDFNRVPVTDAEEEAWREMERIARGHRAVDATGRDLHVGDRVVIPDTGVPRLAPQRGRVVRLWRTAGVDRARVRLDTGSTVNAATQELAEPCPDCGGYGSIPAVYKGVRYPGEPDDCDHCEGTGVQGGQR
jgi:hypothetical protein